MTRRVAAALRVLLAICTAGALRALLAACAACMMVVAPAHADKSDREKPINFSADQPAEVDFERRVGTLRGNVIITQGTMTIRADRIDFKQNPDNSLSATAYGNPVSFRQKKDGSDEYFEGFAQRAVYDGQKQTLELFDRALLKQGNDEIRSNYVSYNSATGIFKAEGRPDAPGVEGPGDRVRGVFQPRADNPFTPGGAPKKDGGEPAKDASTQGDAKAVSKDAKPAAPKAPPLTLKPDPSLPAKK
jgi:lipopolysaccharide export system protein LptA